VAREGGSSNQVVVAIFRSLGGESLEDFSVRLAQAWRAGQKGLDNGVVLLVFLDDRRMRLEVGYGLEATLTDAMAASIVRDVIAPRLREGRLADGIAAGLDAVDAALAGVYQRPARPRVRRGPSSREVIGLLAVLAVAAAVPLLGTILALTRSGRSRRHGWTGGRGGWTTGGIAGGGSGWSGGGGSSSSDSWSGGGGSFGGGGASGSW
jgi:uncharacterized protein